MPSKKTTKKTTTKKAAAKKSTKKAVKKTTAKKVAKKAVSKKAVKAPKVLVCARGEECFWVQDGTILSDLAELAAALEDMSEAVFAHHVASDRNDFADWVEHVLQDGACASAMRRSRKPKTAHTVVVRHLRTYNL